jgi:hypothetical protein
MKIKDEFEDKRSEKEKLIPSPNQLPHQNHLVVLFTGTAILLKMKQTLGMEAMLEYMESFFIEYEQQHPLVQTAVLRMMNQVSVQTLYKEAMGRETPQS